MAGVLVAVEAGGDADATLELGLDVARSRRDRIVLLAVARGVPATAYCSPVCGPWSCPQLQAEILEEAHDWCTALAGRVPDDIPVEFRVLRGRPDRVLRDLIARSSFAAVVVEPKWLRRRRMRRYHLRNASSICVLSRKGASLP